MKTPETTSSASLECLIRDQPENTFACRAAQTELLLRKHFPNDMMTVEKLLAERDRMLEKLDDHKFKEDELKSQLNEAEGKLGDIKTLIVSTP